MEEGGKVTPQTQSSKQVLGDYSAYIITWNVGSRFPDNISLRNLLNLQHADEEGGREHLPDIYAMGLQEVNAQPQQQMLGLFKSDPWTAKAKDMLAKYDYVAIKTEQMQGLLLSMFVKRQHVPHLRDIEAEFTRTGFGGIWGNKGAVSVRFNLYGCGLAFVVAHLAAHDHHLDERIEDYEQILENHHYHVAHFREINDHDYVFWFGDLNFRLQGTDSPAEVRDAVLKGLAGDSEILNQLMRRDQLQYVREETQQAFKFMHERLPAFPPTFKFHEGSTEYDLKRRPAWTDRILYAVQPANRQPNMPLAIEQRSYKSHPGYNISDHKPVTSEFCLRLYPSYRAPSVTFTDINVWQIGAENTIEYSKPLDFEEKDHDWIGIYKMDFASLGEYVAYEYVNQAETPPAMDRNSPVDPFFETPSTHRHGGHRHRNRQRLRREQQENNENICIDFADDIDLRHGEQYLLIYFQNTGIRGVTSVAGLSTVFRAEKRSGSPRHAHVD